jgi:hypothetical protein
MAFITLILKNLARQPVRAGLTMLGIAIGITTVVALGVITEGLKASAGQILRVGGADFIVAQEGTADLSFSNVSEEDLAAVAALPDVASATGALMDIERVGSSPFFVVMGLRAEDLRMTRRTRSCSAARRPARSISVWAMRWRSPVIPSPSSASTRPATPGSTAARKRRSRPCNR